MRKLLSYLMLTLVSLYGFGQIINQGFSDISSLASSGAAMTNQSSTMGLDDTCNFGIFYTVEPITRVVLADIDNTSSPDTSSEPLEDFTHIVGNMATGIDYDVALEGNTAGSYTTYFTIFVDTSDSGDWSDYFTQEIGSIANSTGTDGQQATGIINLPTNLASGSYNLRVVKNFNVSPLDPCAEYNYGQAEDYTIEVTAAEDCTGTPDAGTVSGPDIVCPNTGFSLTTEGATAGYYGISYQWQSAPAGSDDWTDIEGANSFTYNVNDGIATPTDFRFTVDCSLSGEQGISNVVSVDTNTNAEECYCIPEGTNESRFINNFTATGNGDEDIENLGSGFSDGGYGDFTDMIVSADLDSGLNFEAGIEGGTAGFRIWVDWNRDGYFDAESEVIYSSSAYLQTHSGNIIIPSEAGGDYRMRIVSNWSSNTGDVDPCATGFTGGEFEDYTLRITILDECEGTPDAGTASGPDMMCPNAGFTISSEGVTHGFSGMSYQWQSAPAGSGNWTDIEGANSDSYHVAEGITAATDYRYVVSCTFSGEQSASNVVSVAINTNAEECYCIPAGTNSSYFINNFTATGDGVTDINNMGSGFSDGGYGDFTDMEVTADFETGVNFTVDINGGTAGFRVWVDWNRDGQFDTAEEVVYFSSAYAANHTGGFDVPVNASGNYRMRIVSHWLNNAGDIDPCSTEHTYGEFEDYTLHVNELDDCGATESGTAEGPDLVCPNVAFTLASPGATTGFTGLNYQWQSSPAGADTWSDIENANSITYNMADGIDAPTDFRFVVTCIISGESSISNIVSVDVNFNTEECYCIPAGTNSQYYINNFTAVGNGGEDINNTGSGFSDGGYGDFTDMVVTVDPISGLNFQADIVGGTAGFRVWIDWNKDGNFDPVTEVVFMSAGYTANHTGSIEIPESADGEYRMRVVSHYLNSAGEIDPCETQHTYGEFEDYTINVAPLEDCSGTPNAGTAQGPGEKCPNATFEISSIGATSGFAGLTYQWQSTPAGDNNWEDMTGATSQTYVVLGGITEATSYRLVVTCTLSGQSAVSNVVTVTINNNTDECYCIPEGTDPGRYIDDFMASGNGAMEIENTGSGFSPGGYGDFSDMVVTADAGGDVEFTANFVGGTFGARIWVDWNKDGQFDPNEEVVFASGGYVATHSGTFTTPEDAVGSYRMRIVAHWLSTTGDVDPCATGFTYGEFEDYTLSIGTGADCQQNYTGDDLMGLTINLPNMAANDFYVEEDVQFDLAAVTFEVASPNGSPQTFDIAFYSDNNGQPGTLIGEAMTDVTPSEVTPSGIFEGTTFPKWLVKVEMPEVVPFIGTETGLTHYWIVVNAPADSGNQIFWIGHAYDENVSAYPAMISGNGTSWTVASDGTNNAEGNMKVEGQCETLVIGNELSSFNFSYYPNPVSDVLHINSAKKVENVQVFNLAGQQVMRTKQLNGQLDVTSLPAGVYLFRAVLEGGQVETFKIIKK